MPAPPLRRARWLHVAIHAAALAPLTALTWLFLQDRLGPAPVVALVRGLGRYALLFLLLSLVPTAIRIVTGLLGLNQTTAPSPLPRGRSHHRIPPWALSFARATLGLYAFKYAALHLLAFAGLDYRFNLPLIATTILQSRREIVGLAAFLILALLALTSIPQLMRALGKYWKPLHRLVYVAAALVVLHYAWNYKELRTWPVAAGIALLTLLAARLPLIARSPNQRRRP